MSRIDKYAFSIVCITLSIALVGLIAWTIVGNVQSSTTTLPQVQVVETEIVVINRTGDRTIVTEVQTGQQHTFELVTTRHRRGNAPQPQTRTHTNTDVLRIYSRGAI